MRAFSACLLLPVVFTTPALAEPLKFKPLVDTRLRFEHVSQDGLPEKADAVTARARAGFEFANSAVAFLAEAEGTLAINEDYNSGVNGKAQFPVVGDPENVELNRLQLQLTALPKTIVTIGRQRINLDDQRFVGSVGWRDNEQTFDAVRIEHKGIKNLKADLTYAWSDRTIWGIDGFGARPQAISGDNIFANLAYTTPYGTLTGFAYLIEQDEPLQAALLRNSSQTYGARFAGAAPLSKTVKLNYALSYAYQTDYKASPVSYSADYYLIEAGVDIAALKLLAGYEVLGSDGSAPGAPGSVFAFMTPLATLHKFQGWADKFLATPANGIRDLYGSASYGWKKVGPFDSISLQAAYHRYDSDRLDQHYGDEINLLAAVKIKKYTITAKYADYNAKALFTDTSKFWLSLEWAY